MAVEHVDGPLRLGPSGPKANLPAPIPPTNELTPFYHIENVTFGQFTWTRYQGPPNPPDDVNESQSTREQDLLSSPVLIWPLPPDNDLASLWDVIANPIPIGEGGRPAWMDSFSISHVRIEGYTTVFPDGNNPTIPVGGAQAANVVLGLSLLKEIAVPVPGVAETVTAFVAVDLMFFKRGILLNQFVSGPA